MRRMSRRNKGLRESEQSDILEGLIISGRCTAEELQQFSAEELVILARATAEYLDKGHSLTIKAITASDYLFEVPDIVTFVESDYYLGNELGYILDRDGARISDKRQIYDFWVDRLQELYLGNRHYTEVLITGAIGIGKTTFMNVIQLYELAHLLALKNPQLHYGLMPSTVIVLAFFNILKNLVMDVGYRQFQDMMDSSPFFKKVMGYNAKMKAGTRYVVPASRRVEFALGSRIGHTLGRAVFCAQIDEANFGQDKEDKQADDKKSQVYDNYISLLNRKTSRFPTAPGKFCIGSSKRSTADFLEKHIEASKSNPAAFVVDAPQFVVKRCRGIYSGKTFRLLLGDLTRNPRILADDEEVGKELESFVRAIPVEHKKAYEDDIIGALRDISGVAAMPKSAFFTDRDMIRRIITDRQPPWKYTSAPKTVPNTINVSFYGTDQIADFLKWDLVAYDNGRLPYSHSPRFIAVDTGYAGDAAGIAMVCRAGIKILNEAADGGGRKYVPAYHTDFYIRIKGAGKQQFPLNKLTEFVKFLIKTKNVNVKAMTTDGFQSVQLRQDIKIAFPSMDVELLSVDRDDACYMSLRNTVSLGAITGMYRDDNIMVELFDLLHLVSGSRGSSSDLRKMVVDHPQVASDGFVGRKDVADTLAAAIYNCKQIDQSVSVEEITEQVRELETVDLDGIMREADEAVEQAMRAVSDINIDGIMLGKKS